MAHFASTVKVDWSVANNGLIDCADRVADYAQKIIQMESFSNLRILPADAQSLLLKDSISPLPLHKSLILLEAIRYHLSLIHI